MSDTPTGTPADRTADVPADRPTDVPADAAVVDRIEDGRHAVLLVGPAEVEVVLDIATLPAGTREGDWLRIGLTSDVELTESRRSGLTDRLERIRRTRSGGRFS
jgi:hypothetical protein